MADSMSHFLIKVLSESQNRHSNTFQLAKDKDIILIVISLSQMSFTVKLKPLVLLNYIGCRQTDIIRTFNADSVHSPL